MTASYPVTTWLSREQCSREDGIAIVTAAGGGSTKSRTHCSASCCNRSGSACNHMQQYDLGISSRPNLKSTPYWHMIVAHGDLCAFCCCAPLRTNDAVALSASVSSVRKVVRSASLIHGPPADRVGKSAGKRSRCMQESGQVSKQAQPLHAGAHLGINV